MAELRMAEHKLDEAEALYRSVIEKLGRLEGEFAKLTLQSRYGLAGVLKDQGRLEDAEAELIGIG